jgi:hypothetical protein
MGVAIEMSGQRDFGEEPRKGGEKSYKLPAALREQIEAVQDKPATRLLGIEKLAAQREEISTKHIAELHDLHTDLTALKEIILPRGYSPESEQFAKESATVDIKTGLLSESVAIQIRYTPSQPGLLWSQPATLKGSLMIAERSFPLSHVIISAPGQRNLSDGARWSHERICEEVAQYVYLLCREAEVLARQHQAEENFIDFDPEFEAHLVRKVAHATNLLQLPEYYRAFRDKETSKEAVAGETERLKTHFQEVQASFDSAFERLHTHVVELDTSIATGDGLADLQRRAREEAARVIAEVRTTVEGEEITHLKSRKKTLYRAIEKLEDSYETKKAALEEKIRRLEKKHEKALDRLSEPKVRLKLLERVNESIGEGYPAPIINQLLDAVAESYAPRDPKTVLDLDNFCALLDEVLAAETFEDVLKELPRDRDDISFSLEEVDQFMNPEKASKKDRKIAENWQEQLNQVRECMSFLSTHCTRAEAETLKKGFETIIFTCPADVQEFAKVLLGK